MPALIAQVVVKSDVPKARPETVTDSAPLEGTLSKALDATGASNVNSSSAVPVEAVTVNCEIATGDVLSVV